MASGGVPRAILVVWWESLLAWPMTRFFQRVGGQAPRVLYRAAGMQPQIVGDGRACGPILRQPAHTFERYGGHELYHSREVSSADGMDVGHHTISAERILEPA